ncbi:MAG: CAP domain-containing protein [Bacteroidota bacterium]
MFYKTLFFNGLKVNRFLLILMVYFCISSLNAQTGSKKNPIKTQKGQKSRNTSTTTINYNTPPSKPKAKWDDVLLKESDLSKILNDVSSDTILQIERLSAYFFHQLINEYRIKNNKGWLYWDDLLWIAARNHNLYITHNYLTHDEVESQPFFTGNTPGNRLNYIFNGKSKLSWSGENCYDGWYNGTQIEEIAKSIASLSFQGWKHSPGHNANMLLDRSISHGTSFYINKVGRIIGTSVFAFNNNAGNQEIVINWNADIAKQNISTFIIKDEKILSSISDKDLKDSVYALISAIMPTDKSKRDEGMKLAATKHVLYLKSNKSNTLLQQSKGKNYYGSTTKRRYLKACKYASFFYLMSHKIDEKCFVISIPLTDFIDKTVLSKIEKKLAKSFPSESNIQKWGAAVAIYEKENQYNCIIDVVWEAK